MFTELDMKDEKILTAYNTAVAALSIYDNLPKIEDEIRKSFNSNPDYTQGLKDALVIFEKYTKDVA